MFSKFNFKDYINDGLKKIGFYEPTLIQEKVIPLVLNKENIIGKSQTGTGKTHAFILPMLQLLDLDLKEIQSVIITPTRELAYQIYENIIELIPKNLIDVRIYVGGTNRESEINRLNSSQPQIVIGTIGKLTDLAVNSNVLKIHTASFVVIDEADMVFEISEIEEIDVLFSKFIDFQVLSFSATIPNNIISFLNKYLEKHVIVDLVQTQLQNPQIDHYFLPVKSNDKFQLLVDVLKTIQPYLVLVFANTVEMVNKVHNYLVNNNIKAGLLTGELESRERKQVLKRIKDGIYQYVVCSDIASRGVDITGVSHIINFELPSEVEFYIHRIGRTARFNMSGVAITLYDYEDNLYLKKLKDKKIEIKFMALKDNTLVAIENKSSFKKSSNLETLIHLKHPVSKKVKPGYKKKRKEVIEKEIKKVKRSKIEAVYRRKKNNENR